MDGGSIWAIGMGDMGNRKKTGMASLKFSSVNGYSDLYSVKA